MGSELEYLRTMNLNEPQVPQVRVYASDLENSERDFKYRINKEVDKDSMTEWSALDQNLQYMNKTVWMQQFNYEEDQMGGNWQITQTLAFNMSGEAFCTLTVRDKDGDM